jgi:hypothetical protein
VSVAEPVTARGPLVPRPVFCVIADEHRDLAMAEAVAAGVFTHAGITLDLGPEPDWLGAELPPDKEWRIEWTKFYYGLDLAHAFAVTGERRFLAAWERLAGSFARRVPVGTDTSDVAARRVQNWLYAWQAFAAAPGFGGLRDGLEEELLEALGAQLAFIDATMSPERNHRTMELYALFVVALGLPALDGGGVLLRRAMAGLHENLLTDVRPDGVQREHSTHYHLIALRSFLAALENARRYGLAFPDGYEARLHAACDFALHCHRPDGTIPALSDSDTGAFGDLLGLAADLLDRPDLRFFATRGAAGTPPARRLASFPDGGYHVQRSGWASPDERFLIFDCGALGDGGHGHYDVLSLEACAGGRPLVMDPGRFTYAEGTPNWRHWFKGTAAHNTVVVDGRDQVPYRRGKPAQGTHPQVALRSRDSAPGLDVLVGETRSVGYDAVHVRRVAFVAGAFWVIEDELSAPTRHVYDARWHLAPEAQGAVSLRGGVVRAPGLALVAAGEGTIALEDGWIAPKYGIRRPAPVVSVRVEAVEQARLVTVLVPLGDGDADPVVAVRRGGGVTAVEVTAAGGVVDRVRWSAAPRTVALGAEAVVDWERRVDGAPVEAASAAGGAWVAWTASGGVARGRGSDL